MKIGPLEIKLQASNGARPAMGEIGDTGTLIFDNQLMTAQDYNDALNPPQSYDVYDKMRLGDGTVAAALRVIKLPLLNADWKVEPASDSAEDREIAAFIDEGFESMTTSRQATFRQILLHLDYGNAPFEKVWEVRNGLVYLRKLALRHPKSITKWITDDKGGLQGIEQTTAPTFKAVTIPIGKLCVFVHDLEGSNFQGISILRPAYKHWYYVDGLERVQAIGIEKRAGGVDVGRILGEDATDEKRREVEKVLQSVHAHEKFYVTEVADRFEYRVQGIEGDVLDPKDALERHDLRIVRSMITEFLAMGAGSTGSLAMHKDKSSFAMLALGGIANNVAETLNRHLIRQWVDFNWTVKEYPRLQYSHLDARPLAEFADAVLKFSEAKVLHPSPDVEEAVRGILDLPGKPPDLDMPMVPVEEMPTEQLVAQIRANRAELRERRAATQA